mgnify:CR=1 FL=1
MQEQTALARLSEKIAAVVQQYKELRDDNEMMQLEMAELKIQTEQKDQEIARLVEQLESIVENLESFMA